MKIGVFTHYASTSHWFPVLLNAVLGELGYNSELQVDDFFPKFNKIINNPQQHGAIRKRGREFVLKNHTIKNRVDDFKGVMERVCS